MAHYFVDECFTNSMSQCMVRFVSDTITDCFSYESRIWKWCHWDLFIYYFFIIFHFHHYINNSFFWCNDHKKRQNDDLIVRIGFMPCTNIGWIRFWKRKFGNYYHQVWKINLKYYEEGQNFTSFLLRILMNLAVFIWADKRYGDEKEKSRISRTSINFDSFSSFIPVLFRGIWEKN